MFEPKKTIVMFVFILFVILFSGSLGLPDEVSKEILDINKSIRDTDLERETSDIGVLETDQYPDDSASLPLDDSNSCTQESNEAIQENTLSLSYFFSTPLMEKIGEYDVPSISQLQNEINPGMPIIPVKSAKILLPQGENLLDIEVVAHNEIVLDGKYFIKPGGWPAIFDSENLSLPVEPINLTIYNSEEEFPGMLCSKGSVQSLRGYQILILNIYPMQYIPALGKVIYYERIDLVITTLHTGEKSSLYRGLVEDRNLVEKIVDNPEQLTSYKLKTEEKPKGGIVPASITNASESYDYVIITNNALLSSFQYFANYKNSTGIDTIVVKREDINSDPDYNGNDSQEEIRNFIIDAYINWSISYVLLGGDDEIIPHRGCYGFVFSFPSEEDDDIPTDMYYAGLDGNWDNDGDHVYGEKAASSGGGGDNGEESDLYAEVFVGRAPVNTVTEANIFINKTIYFEANPRPKHVTLHGQVDSSGPYYLDEIKNGENKGGGSHVALGVESYIPSIYNITRLYEAKGTPIDGTVWETEIANNTLFVNHGGHGLVESYRINETNSYSDTNADDVVNSYYPIHLSIACYSGSFDGRNPGGSYVSDKDCLAEEYITNPNGGFVACILNSRYGWFISGDVTMYSGELDNEFYNQLFNNNEIRLGKTLQKTKEEFVADALTHNTYRWVVYEWNLLGDPTLQIFGIDNVTPIADAGPDNSTGTDQPIMMDGSGSTDDSGYIAWYNWTFGDGTYFNGSGPSNAKVVHMYSDIGLYEVTLNVSDAWGNWDDDTVNITVYDATPPVTNITIGVPKYRNNTADDWNITQTTTFNLSASDKYSFVNFTWYTIDGIYFEYSVSFTLSGYNEGPHYITWGSEDGIGNNETDNAMTVWIDESPPITFLVITEPKEPAFPNEGCNVTSGTIFTLVPQDQPSHNSSAEFSWYIIDTDYYEGTQFFLLGYGEGMHTITWGSKDNLGFNETGNTIEVWVDDTAPQTIITIDQPRYPSSPDYGCNVTSSTTITLTPLDRPIHNAGPDISWYTIESDYYEGDSFNLSGYPEGQINITWGCKDKLGNNETGNFLIVWLDDSEPVTSMTIGLPKYPILPANGTNVTSSTPFTLTPNDQPLHGSGIFLTWYMIDIDYYEGNQFILSGYDEGAHIITWGSEDNLGHNESKTIIIWVDDSSPITNLTIGSPKFPPGGFDGCYVTSYTTFTFLSEDYPAHNSSVKKTWYTINLKYHEGSSFMLSDYGLDEEGQYNITWGSIDNLGNNETGNLITVYLDRRTPSTKIEIDEPKYRTYDYEPWNVTLNTSIKLNSSDLFSGVDFSWYIIDGQYFEGSIINLSGYGEGFHTIIYGSQDNLSQNETGNIEEIVIDLTSPFINLSLGEPKFRLDNGHHWNITGSTIFRIISNDNISGIDTAWYSIDGKYFEGSVFTLGSYLDGNHTIIWGARDNVGNNKTGNTYLVYLDTKSPITNISISDPKYLSVTDNWYVTSKSNFNLTAMDFYSGINFTWYKIDGNYFEGVNFNLSHYDEGAHTINWGSVDLLGNNETGNSLLVFLDNSSPSTEINLDKPKYQGSIDDQWNVTEQTNFTLIGTDSYSGVKTYWYTIDGVYFEGLKFNLSGYLNGPHIINWGSKDNLDHNETSNSIVVYLDTSPPLTEISLSNPKHRSNELHIWNITQSTLFDLISYDENCGVSLIWYTIDGEYFEDSRFRLNDRIDGLHIITWGAQDNLGNKEITHYLTVNLDSTPPSTTIYIGGEIILPSDERITINSSTLINLSADDEMGVGVDFIWFSIDGGLTYNVYKSPFTVPLKTSTVMYGAKDLLGNNATSKKIEILVDDSEPDTNGDGDGDTQPSDKDVFDMLMDYLYLLIILIIVIIVIILIILFMSRKKKGKEDRIDFQTEAGNENMMVEVEEEVFIPPPPPPPPPPPK